MRTNDAVKDPLGQESVGAPVPLVAQCARLHEDHFDLDDGFGRPLPRDHGAAASIERLLHHARTAADRQRWAPDAATRSAAAYGELIAAAAIAARLPSGIATGCRTELTALSDAMTGRLPAALSKAREIEIARAAGRSLGQSEESLFDIAWGIRLLPLARFCLPDELLRAEASLCADQWLMVRCRVTEAARAIANVSGLASVAAVVLGARERADTSGYPFGVSGAAIPRESAIVAVCEAYGALRSQRAWRSAHDRRGASAILRADPGFGSDVIEAVRAAAAELD